jgi:hypothetical protein
MGQRCPLTFQGIEPRYCLHRAFYAGEIESPPRVVHQR